MVMYTVIGLMLSADIVIERHAVCPAGNLMEMMELHSRLMEQRGVPPLVALAANDDSNSRGESCRCLATLSVNSRYTSGGVVKAPSANELNCQRYASLCLAIVATTVAVQVKAIQSGAVRPLIVLGCILRIL